MTPNRRAPVDEPMIDRRDRPLGERVSALEASVTSLHADLSDIRQTMTTGFADLQTLMRDGSRTNWSVVLAGVVVAMGIWAAAIRPISNDVARLDAAAVTLATAVVEQNRIAGEVRIMATENRERITTLRADLEAIREHGTPVLDTRITVLEQRLGIKAPRQ